MTDRRFPRAQLLGAHESVQELTGARLTWPNFELSTVLDLSLMGIAVSRPALYELRAGAQHRFLLHFSGHGQEEFGARVVWVSDTLVGMEFLPLAAKARALLMGYLRDLLVGMHLRRIDPQFFTQNQSFTVWYAGPRNCHVFFWYKDHPRPSGGIERVQLLLDDEVFEFQGGHMRLGSLDMGRRALFLLGQLPYADKSVKDLVASLSDFLIKNQAST